MSRGGGGGHWDVGGVEGVYIHTYMTTFRVIRRLRGGCQRKELHFNDLDHLGPKLSPTVISMDGLLFAFDPIGRVEIRLKIT